jgi:DNA mismatch endonuclease, patch repair protein
MDNLTSAQRAKCMAHIKRKDTKAEIVFRKAIWHTGTKGYRIDVNLPGRPDLFFPRYKLAIFIDGCFWHKCPECFVKPKSNQDYWLPKIERNVERDRENEIELRKKGIKVIRFWEHNINKNLDSIIEEFVEKYEEIKNKTL